MQRKYIIFVTVIKNDMKILSLLCVDNIRKQVKFLKIAFEEVYSLYRYTPVATTVVVMIKLLTEFSRLNLQSHT